MFHCRSVLRYCNEDAKSAMNHLFCFQRRFSAMNTAVETVVVSFASSPTQPPDRRLNDDSSMRAGMLLEVGAAC
jgi:hypothetical protein